MVTTASKNKIDLSFIPSYLCNLKCNFCMYSCSKDNKNTMDLDKTKKFIDSIDWDWINSIGFYGGEMFLFPDILGKIIDYLPKEIDKWCITNGSWSRTLNSTEIFLDFIGKHNLRCYVSSTPSHKKYQSEQWLNYAIKEGVELKKDDTQGRLLPMGRNKCKFWDCSEKCKRIEGAARYALTPTGNIIFQSCDGVYPIVGVDYPDFHLIKKHYLSSHKIKFDTYSPLYVIPMHGKGYYALSGGRKMTNKEFEKKTEEWHNNDYEGSLPEFLNMTFEEYAKHVEGKVND